MFVHARMTERDLIEDCYDTSAFISTTALPMIISNRLAATVSGANHAVQHLLNADDNEIAECIQGSPRDLIDMVNQARGGGKKYSMMQFIVAPNWDMSRADFFTFLLPLIAMVFGFAQLRCVVFEHVKRPEDRKNGGSLRHWHICVSYVDPITGKVSPGWRMSHAKCERVSREAEARGWDGPHILKGRFTPAVIAQLRSEGKHDVADKIEAAHAPYAQPEGRTAPLEIEQPARAAGIDLRAISKAVKQAFYASDDHPTFTAKLADIGLELRVTNRGKSPAWAVFNGPDDSDFVNLLTRCLPGVPRHSIINIVEKNYDGRGNARAVDERGAEAAEHVGLDQPRGAVDAEGTALVPDAAAQPGGSREPGRPGDGRAEQLFVEALGIVDAETGALDRLLADAQALCFGTAAVFAKFFRNVELAARRWLDGRVTKYANQRPAVSMMLEGIRAEGDELRSQLGKCNVAVLEASSQISRMLGVPGAPTVGAKVHKQRMAEAQKEYDEAVTAQKAAADAYKAHQDQARIYEDDLAARQGRWDAKMDELARKWLAVAASALATVKRFPRLVQYGPEAILALGMSRYGDPQPRPAEDEDYSSNGPRGPK
ncbi:hypothetical protein [Bradyrhizobium guangxiense]|uniref:hypothetical protein n=1 Tax=Bradyrhizobium guangxiense TaxID=1325115 RepID=UPI001008E01E|nr:hypothetical protein [Bradyrhizobium guangxiense]